MTQGDERVADPRRSFPGRLNLFQATMLDWRDFHPYNAVHAAQIDRPLDQARVATAIEGELSRSGLAGLDLDHAHARYAWRGGRPDVVLETVSPGPDWVTALAQAFERHLNTPFVRDGPMNPFRFFVMPVDAGFFLGIAYDHFIAGGDSIIVLLNAIAHRYAGNPCSDAPLQLYPRTHARLFLRHPLAFARGLARLPSQVASCRRGIRPRYRRADDGYNAFTFFRVAPDRYRALRDAAHAFRVTLNDALMALLLLAQDATLPPRDMGKRRHELAVASIVNLRGAHGDDPRATFGQFLSSFRVAHPVPSGITLRELAQDVHAATSRIKREKLFLTTLFAMSVDRALGRWRTLPQRIAVYAKSYPVGAGVSSLNVDALWRSAEGERAPLYVRGVPTGPLSPIVLAVTTSAHGLCAGISYRTTAFSQDDVAAIRDDLLRRIEAL
ncbi:MAG: hypothetical protein ACM3JC_05260 [Rudaea sp.]